LPNELPSRNSLKKLSEAYTLLAEASPGEEIDVSRQFTRELNLWIYYQASLRTSTGQRLPITSLDPRFSPLSPDRFYILPSSYNIYYLYRSVEDWGIDHLVVQGSSVLRENPDVNIEPRLKYYGPYQTIFEGRFKQEGFTLWLSTYDETIHNLLLESAVLKPSLSTPEIRFKTLQAINDFFVSCIKVNG